ncbi:prepilin-type N-terminal cleavage/methylation domain [Klebsiella variicola]|uniref:Prepilin-type N-terminal cleavage/methylation domain n=1 Tax=Klebsiella variicola TaxID=244366 RepID=A0A7H4MDF0_KLEVA|nr:prepilin-type N-terminal cleavage/methylation domain [Klebsiella variicola]
MDKQRGFTLIELMVVIGDHRYSQRNWHPGLRELPA